MFPLTIRLTKHLYIEKVESADILPGIADELKRLAVNDVVMRDRNIIFKNAFFNRKQGRGHKMTMVDRGTFDYDTFSKTLVYRFSTTRSCLFCLGMSALFGLLAQSIFIWLFMFLWFYGVNWIICLIRQWRWFDGLLR